MAGVKIVEDNLRFYGVAPKPDRPCRFPGLQKRSSSAVVWRSLKNRLLRHSRFKAEKILEDTAAA
jgi:hypothetical protein